jgi:hypothetical protein
MHRGERLLLDRLDGDGMNALVSVSLEQGRGVGTIRLCFVGRKV